MLIELILLVLKLDTFTMVVDFPMLIEVALVVPKESNDDESSNGVVIDVLNVFACVNVLDDASFGILEVRYTS